jgi:hypothetical protein
MTFACSGAYPPDLSLIVKARVGADNYLMALLTGYRCSFSLSSAPKLPNPVLRFAHALQGPARRHHCGGRKALQPLLSRRRHQHEAGDCFLLLSFVPAVSSTEALANALLDSGSL